LPSPCMTPFRSWHRMPYNCALEIVRMCHRRRAGQFDTRLFDECAWGYVPNVRWQFQPTLLHRLILGLPFGRCTAGTLDCTVKETRPEACRIKANKMERTLETLKFSLAIRACSRSLNEPLLQTNQSTYRQRR